VSVEPWWRRAVFYRIDPDKFQDSDGDGRGDLAGVTQRLDYLQSLGVDALILNSTSESGVGPATTALSAEEFDALARAAVSRQLRVLVELGAPTSQDDDAQYVAAARGWLNQGAAGLYVPTRELEAVDGAEHIALLLHQLRALTNSFPGGRVLLADAPAKPDPDLLTALAKETQLTAGSTISVATASSAAIPDSAMPPSAAPSSATAASLRAQLTAALGNTAGSLLTAAVKRGRGRRRHAAAVVENNPLLLAARVSEETDGAAREGLERALAVMLLASRTAVLLEYGQELGLDAAETNEPLMQWTPSNLTREPKPEPPAPKPEEPGSSYVGFYAFVPPPPRNLFAPPKMPVVEESDEPGLMVPVVIDPDSLRGFTAGTFDAALTAANGSTANVAVEQANPRSLLNLYRQLIQLHHDNATVRNGAQTVLDYDAEDALVWVRRAPASSRTSANVVAACNLSDKPVVVGDLGAVRVRGLRSLLSPQPKGALLTVAPGAVLVGQVR
jgi:alpha-glucosidase